MQKPRGEGQHECLGNPEEDGGNWSELLAEKTLQAVLG